MLLLLLDGGVIDRSSRNVAHCKTTTTTTTAKPKIVSWSWRVFLSQTSWIISVLTKDPSLEGSSPPSHDDSVIECHLVLFWVPLATLRWTLPVEPSQDSWSQSSSHRRAVSLAFLGLSSVHQLIEDGGRVTAQGEMRQRDKKRIEYCPENGGSSSSICSVASVLCQTNKFRIFCVCVCVC